MSRGTNLVKTEIEKLKDEINKLRAELMMALLAWNEDGITEKNKNLYRRLAFKYKLLKY